MTSMKQRIGIKSGFTLIELMVVMLIMSLLFGLGFTNFRDFQRRQILEGAVRAVKGDLRYAQELALAGRKPDNPAGNSCTTADSVLHGYQLTRTSSGSYVIEALCAIGVPIKSVVLDSEVEMNSIGTEDKILFKSVTGGISQDSSVAITLTFTEAGVSDRVITVSPAGEIND